MNEDCAICRCPMEENATMTLKCKHKFCTACVIDWVVEHATCPTCRMQFREPLPLPPYRDYIAERLNLWNYQRELRYEGSVWTLLAIAWSISFTLHSTKLAGLIRFVNYTVNGDQQSTEAKERLLTLELGIIIVNCFVYFLITINSVQTIVMRGMGEFMKNQMKRCDAVTLLYCLHGSFSLHREPYMIPVQTTLYLLALFQEVDLFYYIFTKESFNPLIDKMLPFFTLIGVRKPRFPD